jgi:cytochrome c oxidase subunit 2
MVIGRFARCGTVKGFFSALMLMWSVLGHAGLAFNMPRGVTSVSWAVYDLHMMIFWICVVIGLVVFGIMFWSIFHHRKSRGAVPAQFHESTLIEILWTVIPVLILVSMAVPATKTLVKMYDTSDAELTVKVTGYQWRWKYDYLDQDVGFFSVLSTPYSQIHNLTAKNENYLLEVDNPLVVPVGKKVRILTTAADVIHSWWVPELGWKKDAIPGFINESWTLIEQPGTYRGQCAELCGKDHGYMPIVVKAVPAAEFEEWLSQMKAKNDESKPILKTAHNGQNIQIASGGQTL